jgi:hypothetical protein
MRFLVELYRYLILLLLVLTVIAVSFGIAKFATSTDVATEITAGMIALAVLGAVFVILSLGITATFISMHDRLCDLASSTERLAQQMEANAGNAYGEGSYAHE